MQHGVMALSKTNFSWEKPAARIEEVYLKLENIGLKYA